MHVNFFNHKSLCLFFGFLLCLFSPVPLAADNINEAQALFDEGVALANQSVYDGAILKFERLIELLGHDNEESARYYKAMANLWLGYCKKEQKAFQEAILFFGRAAPELEALRKYENAVYCYGFMAAIHEVLRDKDKAIDAYLKVVALEKQLGDKDAAIEFLLKIGVLYKSQGRIREAIPVFEDVLVLYEEAGNVKEAAVHMGHLGFLYGGIDPNKSLAFYIKAVSTEERAGLDFELMMDANTVASLYEKRGEYREAALFKEKMLAAALRLNQPAMIRSAFIGSAELYKSAGDYPAALDVYTRMAGFYRNTGKQADLAYALSRLGIMYLEVGKPDQAFSALNQALELALALKDDDLLAGCYSNLGAFHHGRGEYDKALVCFNWALQIDQRRNDKFGIANDYNSLGVLYKDWGALDRALEYYQKAFVLCEVGGWAELFVNLWNSIGYIHEKQGSIDKAKDCYTKALAMAKNAGLEEDYGNVLSALGNLAYGEGKYQQALDYYQEALRIAEATGRTGYISLQLNNMAVVYTTQGRYAEAVTVYDRALALHRSIGDKQQTVMTLNNLGVTYGSAKKYAKAVGYFNEAIALIEELRQTAPGALKRDFLSSRIHTYELLTVASIKAGLAGEAFDALELSSVKYLLDQMGERLDKAAFRWAGITACQKKLSQHRAVLAFTGLAIGSPAGIVVSHNSLQAHELTRTKRLLELYREYSPEITARLFAELGAVWKNRPDESLRYRLDGRMLEDLVTYFRLLVTAGYLDDREKKAFESLSGALYDFLFSPFVDQVRGKTELVIIPTGILAFLPFEVLRMPDGRYLVEAFDVSYTQSLTVMELLQNRRYTEDRKPLLAFGGAIYDALQYKSALLQSEQQYQLLKQNALSDLERGNDVREYYNMLGRIQWKNLPGTLTEVSLIRHLIKGSVVYSGADVNETKIKKLSAQGELKNYHVLHFATHGIVVPELPELSALVLSLQQQESQDDGYLTVGEIARLDLHADFVGLSACETGLGKLYGGEGVVGLTQAFLLAGANGLSVSLWQVSDESTMRFMTGMYRLVQEEHLSYAQAITRMKRQFIKDGEYSNPVFWACFVYYGKR